MTAQQWTVWHKTWSTVVGGGVGLLLLAGMAGAQPFFGLPGCLQQLNTCTEDLGTCTTDLATCEAAPICGDETVEGEEDCDVNDLDGATCVTEGFAGGELACGTGCTFDTSGCYAARFVANEDGTVTDNEAGRMWVQTTDDDGLRDKDTKYSWTDDGDNDFTNPDGTAFTVYLDGLNNTCGGEGILPCVADSDCSGACGFAGHRDWRLPEMAFNGGTGELESIVDCSFGSPCINEAIFGPTAASFHWSSVTLSGNSNSAWNFSFAGSGAGGVGKSTNLNVRAVRTGP